MNKFIWDKLDFSYMTHKSSNKLWLVVKRVNIRKMTHSISSYLYDALQIQPQILVQITSNSYAAELHFFFFFSVTLGFVKFC